MPLTINKLTLDNLLKIDKIYRDCIEEAVSLVFLRKQRFVEGYVVETELTELYNDFLGNTNVNQKNGLIVQYSKLRAKVMEEKLIGLILIGMNVKNILIDHYPTKDNNIIDLTVESISRIMLKCYFSQDEIHCISQATPNFDMYYDHVLESRKENLD
jgi:hypothetical protein